jgi:hypothetical protein
LTDAAAVRQAPPVAQVPQEPVAQRPPETPGAQKSKPDFESVFSDAVSLVKGIKFEGMGMLRIVSILLFVAGGIGLLMGSMMFGDIGISAYIGSVAAILSGFGFRQCHKVLNNFGNRPHS